MSVAMLQGDHLQLLCQQLLGNHSLPSHGTLMAISAGLFLPTTWLPDLGALSYVGALGVVSALGLTGTPFCCFGHQLFMFVLWTLSCTLQVL